MFYTVYKITNKLNGKIYIGAHKTSDLDDDYMGSGTYLKRAQEKYGIENFEKEILEVFESSEEMFAMEAILVNADFVKGTDNYNLKEGGLGGFDHLNCDFGLMSERGKKNGNMNVLSGQLEQARENCKWLRENDTEWYNEFCSNMSIGQQRRYNNGGSGSFTGKTHSDETKKQMRDSHKGMHEGEKNSQFGSMWIHSLTEKVSKKIKKDELQTYEDLGWIKGRKMKFM